MSLNGRLGLLCCVVEVLYVDLVYIFMYMVVGGVDDSRGGKLS